LNGSSNVRRQLRWWMRAGLSSWLPLASSKQGARAELCDGIPPAHNESSTMVFSPSHARRAAGRVEIDTISGGLPSHTSAGGCPPTVALRSSLRTCQCTSDARPLIRPLPSQTAHRASERLLRLMISSVPCSGEKYSLTTEAGRLSF
jgi:hypothetical protein